MLTSTHLQPCADEMNGTLPLPRRRARSRSRVAPFVIISNSIVNIFLMPICLDRLELSKRPILSSRNFDTICVEGLHDFSATTWRCGPKKTLTEGFGKVNLSEIASLVWFYLLCFVNSAPFVGKFAAVATILIILRCAVFTCFYYLLLASWD